MRLANRRVSNADRLRRSCCYAGVDVVDTCRSSADRLRRSCCYAGVDVVDTCRSSSVLRLETSVAPGRVEENVATEETEPDRPWLVIVWNDPINLMSYVTWVLQKLFGYSLEKATRLMLEVHHQGRSVVSSGSREKAELDCFRLHAHGLWATITKSD